MTTTTTTKPGDLVNYHNMQVRLDLPFPERSFQIWEMAPPAFTSAVRKLYRLRREAICAVLCFPVDCVASECELLDSVSRLWAPKQA